jgi:hypothetical protein
MLSVIVSTRNDERGTVATLSALVPGATAGLVSDVLLLDTTGSDAIKHIADVAGCAVLVHPAAGDGGETGNGLLRAAQQTRAPWLLFLHAGAMLQQGWIEEITQFIESSVGESRDRGAVLRYARSYYGDHTARSLGTQLLRWLSRTSHDQGLLISRAHYQRLGGHPVASRRPEAKLLARLGRRARVRLQSRIVTS